MPYFFRVALAFLSLMVLSATGAKAHFLAIIPSSDTVTEKRQADLGIDLAFAHPMEQHGMDMERPAEFKVVAGDKSADLLGFLKEKTILGRKAFGADYKIGRPGVYQFVVRQRPYFEPAEDIYIVHCAKTVVGAFGDEEGWSEPLGLKAEIVPLSRPFASYAGNIFMGKVLVDGRPAAGVDVEVECWNEGATHAIANAYFVTQVLRTDDNGVFVYGVPWSGWWGFAALVAGRDKMDYQGQPKNVELGAVFWARFIDPQVR